MKRTNEPTKYVYYLFIYLFIYIFMLYQQSFTKKEKKKSVHLKYFT